MCVVFWAHFVAVISSTPIYVCRKRAFLFLSPSLYLPLFSFYFIFIFLFCHWCRKITIWSTLLKTWTNCIRLCLSVCVSECVLNVSVEYELDCFRLCTCSILHMFNSLIKGRRARKELFWHTHVVWVIQSIGSDRGELWIFRMSKQTVTYPFSMIMFFSLSSSSSLGLHF